MITELQYSLAKEYLSAPTGTYSPDQLTQCEKVIEQYQKELAEITVRSEPKTTQQLLDQKQSELDIARTAIAMTAGVLEAKIEMCLVNRDYKTSLELYQVLKVLHTDNPTAASAAWKEEWNKRFLKLAKA